MIELGVPYPVLIIVTVNIFVYLFTYLWHINVYVFQTCYCRKEKAKRMITNRERTRPHKKSLPKLSIHPSSSSSSNSISIIFKKTHHTNRQICPINQKPISSNPGENFLFTTHFLENEPSYSNYCTLPTSESVEWPILDWCTFVLRI